MKLGKGGGLILLLAIVVGLGAAIITGVIPISSGVLRGESGVSLTIFYEDGSERTVDSATNLFSSLIPMRIIDTGGTVTSINVKVNMKPVFEGIVSSKSLDGSWVTMTIDNPATGESNGFRSYTESSFSVPSTIVSGTWYTVFDKTYTASSIQQACGQYGTYSLTIKTSVKLTIDFGVNSDSKSASATGAWGFKYEADTPPGTLSSIDVKVSRSSFR